MKSFTRSQLIARQRIIKSLEKIETAQALLGDACGLLSPVEGLCPEWERLGKLHDKVHAEWHRVSRKVDGVLISIVVTVPVLLLSPRRLHRRAREMDRAESSKHRIQQAMAYIRKAQSSLDQAVVELSDLQGMSSERDRVSTLREQVMSSWNVLENNLQRNKGGPNEDFKPENA